MRMMLLVRPVAGEVTVYEIACSPGVAVSIEKAVVVAPSSNTTMPRFKSLSGAMMRAPRSLYVALTSIVLAIGIAALGEGVKLPDAAHNLLLRRCEERAAATMRR